VKGSRVVWHVRAVCKHRTRFAKCYLWMEALLKACRQSVGVRFSTKELAMLPKLTGPQSLVLAVWERI
jgi:hypothetical protein